MTPYDIALRRSGRLIVTRRDAVLDRVQNLGIRHGRMLGRSTRVRCGRHGCRYRGPMLVYVIAIVRRDPDRAADRRAVPPARPDPPAPGRGCSSPACGLQILLEVIDLPRARYDDVGLAILLASYVLIIGFGLSNLLLTGHGRHHRSASR